MEREQTILELLKGLKGIEPLKKLFWSELNYERVNKPLSRREWGEAARSALAEDPILFAEGGQNGDFHIIYGRLKSDQLPLGLERPVVSRLIKDHPYALFVLSNDAQNYWHFINVKYDEENEKRRLFRRITVGHEERLRTAAERITRISLDTISPDLFGLSPLTIQERHDEAFDVEAVTKQFYSEYEAVFRRLEDDLTRQTKDRIWAHDYSLQFLNRCMFLYFIQRKGWLGDDRDFLSSFWESYKHNNQPNDSFVNKWIKVLFFEAFNNKFHGGHKHFPVEMSGILALSPYLNGGLFTENDLDRQQAALVTDKRFEQIFKFLERYNFTIAEDSPLDKEVAVDPEMIGKVYESLVNVSEEVDERGEAGIFYTPRTEIDLMCRLSLVDNLANHLGSERKNLLYQLIFSLEPEEKLEADKAISKAALWGPIHKLLQEIAVLDPACGSGSFLVGMVHILDDLQQRANQHLGIQEGAYERKKRIIGQSLYGVDVMEWACHVTELRLWLTLIVDAEFTREQLHVRSEPLLPHFSFNVRCGDSLVQEIGGINFGHLRSTLKIPSSIQSRITKLKTEKRKFYNNDKSCQFSSPDEIKHEERRLFIDILDARHHDVQENIKNLRRKIEGPQERQIKLDGTIIAHSHQIGLEAKQYQENIQALTLELERIELSLNALRKSTEAPFVWDISFVEIFEGDKAGFDIVIGNPPYVRHESIAAPLVCGIQLTSDKKEYKNKLAQSVYHAFPHFFGYKTGSNSAFHKLNAKSDLYVYFYFHGLSLLNDKGSFCFITSNSWLDAGYGADLQEFLLKHDHVKLVIDNQIKRSFSNADINSIIILIAAPDEHSELALENTARFVMFYVPFEYIVNTVIFDEIEEATERKITKEYRIFPIRQSQLFQDGKFVEEKADKINDPLIEIIPYSGNKWGGKYLRAPDIYWTILDKGEKSFVKLAVVCEVEGYIHDNNTGPQYSSVPFLKTVKDVEQIHIRKNSSCVYNYGVKETGNSRTTAPILFPRTLGTRHLIVYNPEGIFAKEFYKIIPICSDIVISIAAQLNSTFGILQREILGLVNLGDGAIKFSADDVSNFFICTEYQTNRIRPLFQKMAQRQQKDIFEELKQEDRRQLDSVLFDIIGLTEMEREEVYASVAILIASRIKKAGSSK